MKDSILLFFLGKYKELPEKNRKDDKFTELKIEDYIKKYRYENEKEYSGIQTSDAPIKCLLDCAKNDENPINKIYCIISKEVYDRKVDIYGEEKTSFEWFKKDILEKVNEKRSNDEKIEIYPIYYDFRIENGKIIDDDIGDYALYIYKQLSEKIEELECNNNEIPIYIDYTSGLRDVSFLMTSIIRYLQIFGVKLKKIVYSNFFKKQIFDIGYIYDMYQLINGVSEFINTGNATQLKALYEGNSENDKKIKELINAINNFSETLSLCALSRLDDSYKKLRNAISEFENINNISGMYSQIFKTLLGTIKNKMPFVKMDYVGNEYLIYPELIKWCANNGMLQQALTIYTEKMPIYYFKVYNKELSLFVDLNNIELNAMDSSKEAKGFYSVLFSTIYQKYGKKEILDKHGNNSEFERVRNEISTLLDNLIQEKNFTVDYVVGELESFNKKESGIISDQYLKIISDIIDEIKTNYCLDGKRKSKGDNQLPKTLGNYINHLKDNRINKLLKETLIEDDDVKEQQHQIDKNKTYENKLTAIRIINPENNIILDSNQVIIFNAMKYYFAVKMVRNLVNHANDKDNIIDDGIIEDMEKSYNVVIKPEAKEVKKILLDGIEKTTMIS